jgi:hypothetical protein
LNDGVSTPATPELAKEIDAAHDATVALRRAKGKTSGRADHEEASRAASVQILSKVTKAATLAKPGVTLRRDTHRKARTRYGAPSSKLLIEQADLLIEAGKIEQDKGYRGFPGMVRGQLSVLRPTKEWLNTIKGMSHLAVVTDHAADELVMLKGTKLADGVAADLVDYADTDTTLHLRSQVKLINAAIAHHVAAGNVEWIGESMLSDYLVDVRDTFQQRYFSRGSFESGGRLFGAWWKPLGGAERRRDIRIMGEPVVELDCASMGVMLAYAHAGATPPSGDLYAPRRFSVGSPGDLGIHKPATLARETIKKLTCAMLFDEDKGRNRWPRGFENAGKGVSVHAVMAGIQEMHAPIAQLFGTGFGHYGMFMESSILVETMLRLAVQGIPALDVHESIIVAESHAAVAKAIFASTFEAHMGLAARINEKHDDTDKLDIAASF